MNCKLCQLDPTTLKLSEVRGGVYVLKFTRVKEQNEEQELASNSGEGCILQRCMKRRKCAVIVSCCMHKIVINDIIIVYSRHVCIC